MEQSRAKVMQSCLMNSHLVATETLKSPSSSVLLVCVSFVFIRFMETMAGWGPNRSDGYRLCNYMHWLPPPMVQSHRGDSGGATAEHLQLAHYHPSQLAQYSARSAQYSSWGIQGGPLAKSIETSFTPIRGTNYRIEVGLSRSL